MRHLMTTAALAVLAVIGTAGRGSAQAYPRNPYDYNPGNAGIMGVGPGGREAYHPYYYSGMPGYGYVPGYNYAPNITGLPSQPMSGTAPGVHGENQSVYSYAPSKPHPDAAAIDVKVPAGARLWFQGTETRQRGDDRFFESPPLEAGKSYRYEVKAEWTDDNGEKVERTRTLHVRAGTRVSVDLRKPSS